MTKNGVRKSYLLAFHMEEKRSTLQIGTPRHMGLGHILMACCKSTASGVSQICYAQTDQLFIMRTGQMMTCPECF